MKKPALILFIIISVSVFLIPFSFAMEGTDEYQVQGEQLTYDPLVYQGTAAGEPELYFSNHDRNDEKEFSGKRGMNTVSSEDTILSYISIQNSPDKIVTSISHTFSVRKRYSHSSFKIEMPSTPADIVMFGAAFLTNLVVHEVGHEVVAHHVGAKGSRLDFFQTRNDQFFLGTSSVEDIESESILPYTMGGEFFADLTFEHALQDYRKKPTMYNQALLLSSGIDFAFYCFYAFYASEDHPEFDPVTISEETGLSRDHLFTIVLAKTMINAYRVYSGEDRVIPYFTVDKHSAMLNLDIPFEIPACVFGDCGPPEEEI
jgi:hypothetical protein